MYVYLRKRNGPKGPFVEFYLQYDGSVLGWPTKASARFQGRSLSEDKSVSLGRLGPDLHTPVTSYEAWLRSPAQEAPTVIVILVNSVAPDRPAKRTLADIQKDGIWATYIDTIPKGGPIGAAVSSLFGIPVDPQLHRYLFFGSTALSNAVGLENNDPMVVYHGTAKDNLKRIFSRGLQPTFGMLGTAVYFGSFWKAFRFASLTQEYEKREGAVIRCYAFWGTSLQIRNEKYEKCMCVTCKPKGGTPMADHEGSWQAFFSAAMAVPYVGGPIKNEEYASRDASGVMMEAYGYVVAETEHHEPLNRTVHIL